VRLCVRYPAVCAGVHDAADWISVSVWRTRPAWTFDDCWESAALCRPPQPSTIVDDDGQRLLTLSAASADQPALRWSSRSVRLPGWSSRRQLSWSEHASVTTTSSPRVCTSCLAYGQKHYSTRNDYLYRHVHITPAYTVAVHW